MAATLCDATVATTLKSLTILVVRYRKQNIETSKTLLEEEKPFDSNGFALCSGGGSNFSSSLIFSSSPLILINLVKKEDKIRSDFCQIIDSFVTTELNEQIRKVD